MHTGERDRHVTIERAAEIDDGFTKVEGRYAPWKRFWARKTDVSDVERTRAAENGAEITTRFVVRFSGATRTITPHDRLTCEGRSYNIVGVKEVGRREGIEITASARTDQLATG